MGERFCDDPENMGEIMEKVNDGRIWAPGGAMRWPAIIFGGWYSEAMRSEPQGSGAELDPWPCASLSHVRQSTSKICIVCHLIMYKLNNLLLL